VKFLKVRKNSQVTALADASIRAFSQYLRGDLIDAAKSLRVLLRALR
jgi:hypothetical protein